jgi:NAD(P)-dependent dehydrogenase (short-subunit alcohol dehydrogenase family)
MNDHPFDLSGKIALITGAGGGIGSSIAMTLANAGADIAVTDSNKANAESTAFDVKATGRRAVALTVDVRDPDSVAVMTDDAREQLGEIDILVNGAGIAFNKPSEDLTPEEWLRVIDVNLNGVFWCCQAVGRHMLARKSGVIVNIASMSGVIANKPQPQSNYNASKAGVIMLTQSLAAEWADRSVRVNAVSPGYIGTEMTKVGMNTPEWNKTWLEMTPMGRVGEPVEIANAVWYLASDAASFATGSNLIVDGGYTAW